MRQHARQPTRVKPTFFLSCWANTVRHMLRRSARSCSVQSRPGSACMHFDRRSHLRTGERRSQPTPLTCLLLQVRPENLDEDLAGEQLAGEGASGLQLAQLPWHVIQRTAHRLLIRSIADVHDGMHEFSRNLK